MSYKFSPSSLSLLKDCPRCFWLRFNKNIKRPDGIFPSLPSGMDGLLKKRFDSFRGKLLPPELAAVEGVELFSDQEKLKAWRNQFKGVEWTDAAGNWFHGGVDEVLSHKGKLIVLDYKTRGYPLKEDSHSYYVDQLTIYTYLLRKMGYKTEDYAYLLFYHPTSIHSNGDVDFHADLVKIDVDVANAKRIFASALEVLEGEIPSASDGCVYCRWGRECRGD